MCLQLCRARVMVPSGVLQALAAAAGAPGGWSSDGAGLQSTPGTAGGVVGGGAGDGGRGGRAQLGLRFHVSFWDGAARCFFGRTYASARPLPLRRARGGASAPPGMDAWETLPSAGEAVLFHTALRAPTVALVVETSVCGAVWHGELGCAVCAEVSAGWTLVSAFAPGRRLPMLPAPSEEEREEVVRGGGQGGGEEGLVERVERDIRARLAAHKTLAEHLEALPIADVALYGASPRALLVGEGGTMQTLGALDDDSDASGVLAAAQTGGGGAVGAASVLTIPASVPRPHGA